ncbi:MAG: YjbQ family protein [Anaerolineae bacterium]|jgi:secondary thiamine-phosphate synthase enzyme|nr:YjbQ family protein [Anaerolineae bacterium]MBT7073416.1 YjbQ family protein [Anaerolineae bacterium]MBT7783225.1 YjbQ family protein [Anaerolineae bacterium]
MNWHKTTLEINTSGKGLYEVSALIRKKLDEWQINEGICYLFVQHTSASLLVTESWDPSARADLEVFMEKLAPEDEHWYTHTLEGADDATSHIRAMLTDVSITIPIDNATLSLGQWQGVYLFEHRQSPHHRRVLLRCLDMTEKNF